MTRGQDGSLFLSCIELSSTTLCQSPGAPCCRHYPGTATGGTTLLIRPVMSAFPGRVAGSACASSFSRLTQRSLALRPAHSRCHQFVARLSEGFSHIVTSMTAPVASGWSGCRVGLAPTGKRRLFTAHTLSGPTSRAIRWHKAVLQRREPSRRQGNTWTPHPHPPHEILRRHHQVRGGIAPGAFSFSTTCPMALNCTRSLASAGRVM